MYATKKDEVVTDLRLDEVEVFDDSVRQKIETFEFVHIDGDTTLVAAPKPNERARVFIIFIDTNAVRLTGQSQLRSSLLRFLDRLLLPNDLVGLMTPDMSAGDLVLGRRTTVISDLANDARWLESSPDRRDPKEYAWENCFG